MYRVGFGDCFLVTLSRRSARPAHILIDCGAHQNGDIKTIEQALVNVREATNGRLDVVVASHRHQDHIGGFGSFRKVFEAFQIGEVWLPWTDDPDNARARQLENRLAALVRWIDSEMALSPAAHDVLAREAILNLAQNATSMRALQGGFGDPKRVRYLKLKDHLEPAAGVTGLQVDVLGPPEDEDFLKLMDPPPGEGFLRATAGDRIEEIKIKPFGNWWVRTPEEARGDADFNGVELLSPERLEDLHALATRDLDALSFKLDDARNNTSLVLLLRFGGKTLLFPGDAQYGSWRWWLDNLKSADILGDVDFLKVAHHGSHNASPADAIDGLTGAPAAMISTQISPFPSIPRTELLTRLDEVTNKRVVRSDSLPLAGAPVGPALTALPTGFSRGALWFDYVMTF